MSINYHERKEIYNSFSFTLSGKCPPGQKTHDPEGHCCVLPFEYKGKTYGACTNAELRDRMWCSLDAVYGNKWAYCGKELTQLKQYPLILVFRIPLPGAFNS